MKRDTTALLQRLWKPMGCRRLKKFPGLDLQGSGNGLYRSGTTKYIAPREKETIAIGVVGRRAITDADKSTFANAQPLGHVMGVQRGLLALMTCKLMQGKQIHTETH